MKNLFPSHRKVLIGVVHLKPLPGSPRHRQTMADIIKFAVADAVAYERGGAHAIFIENFGDVPFTKTNVAPETIAAMTAAGCAVRAAVKLPIGYNVLRNDARAALAIVAQRYYRFPDREMTVVGVAEDVHVLSEASAIVQAAGKRTLYTYADIEGMVAEGVDVLVIGFRQARVLKGPVPYADLKSNGVLKGAPQTVTSIGEEAATWLAHRIEL